MRAYLLHSSNYGLGVLSSFLLQANPDPTTSTHGAYSDDGFAKFPTRVMKGPEQRALIHHCQHRVNCVGFAPGLPRPVLTRIILSDLTRIILSELFLFLALLEVLLGLHFLHDHWVSRPVNRQACNYLLP